MWRRGDGALSEPPTSAAAAAWLRTLLRGRVQSARQGALPSSPA